MWLELIVVLLIAYIFYYNFLTPGRKPGWWKKHGIQEIDATSIASQLDLLLGKKNITERDDYAYQVMGSNLKFCGMIESPCPIILLKDLDLIKKIMIKDFDYFTNRRDFLSTPNKNSAIAKILGMLTGDQWKGVRTSMSPAFTTGKIRRMMGHFTSVGKDWAQMLQGKCAENGSAKVDMMACVSQFTIEVIGATVFGMSTGTMKNSESVFATMTRRLVDLGSFQFILMNIGAKFPILLNLFGIEPLDGKALNFFEKILQQSLETRKNGESIKRDDFLQLLLEARKGELRAVGPDELNEFEKEAVIKGSSSKDTKKEYLTDDIIVAQGISFFFGGLLTTASFITFAAYVLAAYPEIQEKVREEVDKVVKEDGTVDYDDLSKLVYLDMVCSEILRKYPNALRLERICQRDYHDPDTGLFVPKGAVVCVPVNAIHHDPKYYENPDKFYPEHFSPENKAKRNPYAFMGFGIGPRNCIGMRFAQTESKTAIAYLLHNFRIEPTEKTPLPIQVEKASIFLSAPKNLELKLVPIEATYSS